MNRAYYACFYAASALFLSEGKHFVKHAGLRSAIHQHLVKSGRISPEAGKFYDNAFEARQEADYSILTECESNSVTTHIASAEQFLFEIKKLLPTCDSPEHSS